MGFFALLAATVTGILYGQFDYSELCPKCGRARDVVDWQFPRTERTYYSVQEERTTSLSAMLEANALLEQHEHEWQFVRGTGNGRTIVLGSGHPISWSLLSPYMGGFMETMLKLTDRDTTLRWLVQLRDPQYSRLCQSMANAHRGRDFDSREEWEDWLRSFEAEHVQLIIQPGSPP
jgi:hypothetical protein